MTKINEKPKNGYYWARLGMDSAWEVVRYANNVFTAFDGNAYTRHDLYEFGRKIHEPKY